MKTLKAFVFIMIVTLSLNTQAKNKMTFANTFGFIQTNTDSVGLAGDNLDLSSVLNIFKQAANVEDFEKNLNAADTKVNNLDLNNDGKVDYIRVIESGNDTVRNLVLQVPVSQSESQDVAVIQVLKKANKTVHVQIVGDEALYGKNYIVEPQNSVNAKSQINSQSLDAQAASTSNSDVNSTSNSNNSTVNNYYGNQQPNAYVNVWGWPSVSLMFAPRYTYWSSPWYWGYYPGWWNPWSPFGPYAYHQRIMGYGYYGFYHRANYNRMGRAYAGYYSNRRVYSPYVQSVRGRAGSVYGHRLVGGFRSVSHSRSNNGQNQSRNVDRNRIVNNRNRGNSTSNRNNIVRSNGNRGNGAGSQGGNRNNGGINSGGGRSSGSSGHSSGGYNGGGVHSFGGGHSSGGGSHGGGYGGGHGGGGGHSGGGHR